MTAHEKILVKWPKVMFPVLVTAVFGVTCFFACIGILYARVKFDAFPEVGMIGFGFVVLVLAFFTWISFWGFLSSLRNLKEPYKRLMADENGILFVVNPRKDEHILTPWREIKEINKGNVKRGCSRPTIYVDTLHVVLYSGSSVSFPDFIVNSEQHSDKDIHLAEDTMDVELDQLIQALGEMKGKAEWS